MIARKDEISEYKILAAKQTFSYMDSTAKAMVGKISKDRWKWIQKNYSPSSHLAWNWGNEVPESDPKDLMNCTNDMLVRSSNNNGT